MNYLTHSEEDYRQALKFFKVLAAMPKDPARSGEAHEREQRMLSAAMEALRYAAVRLENPPLTLQHLKQMHGQPVYCSSPAGGQTGGGFIDARKEQVILLDHSGVWRETWFWGSTGRYYRFPINGVDLLNLK